MNRRTFLKTAAALSLQAPVLRTQAQSGTPSPTQHGQIITVRGPIEPADLGRTLTHEHVLVDFIGADRIQPGRYDRDEAFAAVLPFLVKARATGCTSIVECTPSYLGKDPLLCRMLAEAAGLHILTNVGYYGAAGDRFLPSHAFDESAEQLADRWTASASSVDGTGIPAGLIKIGVDPGPLSDIDRKLVRAAARTHRRTGLTIYSHTGPATPAMEQIAVLHEENVHPSAWVWTHAQNEPDHDHHEEAARTGAWIAFDGLSVEQSARYRDILLEMKRRGLLSHVLISHDAGWYRPGEALSFRPFDFLFGHFIRILRDAGFTPEEIRTLTVTNPARALTVRIRTADVPHPPGN